MKSSAVRPPLTNFQISIAKAFSLIEIVVALGIVSFALVGIMGLFPAAMKSAKESQQETRATHIAQQIFDDLGSLSGTNTFIATGTNIIDAASRQSVNLTVSGTYTVSYNLAGSPIGAGTSPSAVYLATVGVTPNTPTLGLTRVQTTVQAPPEAANNLRSSYVFVTLMNPGG